MAGCTPQTTPPVPPREEAFTPGEEAASGLASDGAADGPPQTAPDAAQGPDATLEAQEPGYPDQTDYQTDDAFEEAPQAKPFTVIDPLTRSLERLRLEVLIQDGLVSEAQVGSVVYRDIENILKNRDPRDAVQITQRISGASSAAHAVTSALALDQALRVPVPSTGRIARNLIYAMDFIQAHILHYYLMCAPDLARPVPSRPAPVPIYGMPSSATAALAGPSGPAMPAYTEDFAEAMEARRLCHEAAALFAGRMPHPQAFVGGGSTESPDQEKVDAFAERFEKIQAFVQHKFAPEVYRQGTIHPELFRFGSGRGYLLSLGAFPTQDDGRERALKRGVYLDGREEALDPRQIKTYVKYAWFDDSVTGKNFRDSSSPPAPEKPGAYSFIKAARYNDVPMEVGPLARMWLTNPGLSADSRKLALDSFGLEVKRFRDFGRDTAFTLMGRHLARLEETLYLTRLVANWLTEIRPGRPSCSSMDVPPKSEGLGLYEAPGGALLHYIRIENQKIASYQIIGPANWNFSPRDDLGFNSPLETALEGTPVPDANNPSYVAMLARAFGA